MEEIKDIKNIGLFFYRGYYEDYFKKGESLGLRDQSKEKKSEETKQKNNRFKELIFADFLPEQKQTNEERKVYNYLKSDYENKENEKKRLISLELAYPGLTSGAGYTFGAGVQGEIQIGFMFDHTTGMPYLPGSSVKGAIRSIYPNRHDKDTEESRVHYLWNEIKRLNKDDEIIDNNNELLKALNDIEETKKENNSFKLRNEIIQRIELEIFEGRNIILEKKKELENNGIKNPQIKEEYYSVYQRDIFHDVYISEAVKNGTTEGKFLGLDYITPHKDNPLKNPIPLPFLKILPGVTIQFDFDLKDGYYLKAKGKEALFRQILLDFGIGAKTNVGYGQFSVV